MGRLTTKQRKKIPAKKFALKVDGKEKYPVENKAHAEDALARESEELGKGNLTPEQASKIKHAAYHVLGHGDSNYHNKG
jgi:hypothetical protein